MGVARALLAMIDFNSQSKLEEPMAESKTNPRSESGTGSGQAVTARDRERLGLRRWEPAPGGLASPLGFIDRMSEEMDRMFDRVFRDFGFPRRSAMSQGVFGTTGREGIWSPRVEAIQKGDRFIVRADLPGLKKDDVQVELTDEALTIHGERQEEHQEEREGYFHSEREYGQFHRTIPLPEGVITESARASFRNGVLEISMQSAPSSVNRGRRIEIKDESQSGEQKK
jgi:HSP20 family protein